MIIIEGPDNSGKTTLGNRLSKRLNVPLQHSGGPAKGKDEILMRTDNILRERNSICIRDRIPIISEYVYANALGRPSFFTDENIMHYLNLLIQMHPVIIFCNPPKEIVLGGNHKFGEHDTPEHHRKVEENKLTIYEMYQSVFSMIPHYSYDWTQDNIDTIYLACDKELNNMRNSHE